MLKKISLILTAVALLTVLVGCGVERTVDRVEDRIEDAVDSMEDTAQRAQQPSATSETTLSKEQAEAIALEHAGFSADQVSRLRTEYEYDDGSAQYDVQFYEGNWEYEFEIHAETGKILSFDKDHKAD